MNESLSINKKVSVSPRLREEPYGSYVDRMLELCNETFSPLYHHVLKQYWHNNVLQARMPHNQVVTNWQDGKYEVYIPTRDSLDRNMQYYRVVIHVVPELDRDLAKRESITLQTPLNIPNGIIDSELQVVVAPTRTAKARKERQFLRGFRHIPKPGYLTAVVVCKIPEIAFKRILTLMSKFIEKRILKLLESLNFYPWQHDYSKLERFYYTYTYIVEKFGYSLASTLKCFSHVLNWINGKVKAVKREIGRQSMVKMAFQKVRELKPILKELKIVNPALLEQLEKALVATQTNYNRPKPREIIIQPAAKRHSHAVCKSRIRRDPGSLSEEERAILGLT